MHATAGGDEFLTDDGFVPAVRAAGLLESRVGDELVLYDVERDRAHALNPAALTLWRACDGSVDVAELALRLSVDRDVIWFGLRELDRLGLLASPLPQSLSAHRIGRREMLKKVAVGSAIGLAVPTIISVVAADPAAAATCRTITQSCTGGQNVCLGAPRGTCCVGLVCCGNGVPNRVCV